MGNENELLDEVVISGSSVEEAVKRALLQLNVNLDDVDVEVIATGSRGVLGLGGEDARVRVRLRDRPYSEGSDVGTDDEEDVAGASSTQSQSTQSQGPDKSSALTIESSDGVEELEPEVEPTAAEGREVVAASSGSDTNHRKDPIDSGEDLEREAEDLLDGLLERMGYMADFEIVSEDPLAYNIVGDEDFGRLIGRRGENLRSLGYLLNLMVGRRLGHPCRVTLDVAGYRQRRVEHLTELAETFAEEVRENKEPITLETMSAYERRVVHVALADDEEVRTYSIGEGEERRVVISPKA